MAANQQRQHRRVITSFMLRFIHEAEVSEAEINPEIAPEETESDGLAPGESLASSWRGVVKHIQSGAEQHFTTLAEAETFIKKYIED
ncbi:MAG TPA: hypothetical protein VH186_27475 [Chloroflexia bacterium]|nr:hypothetical protein [Chloroflexia bacterium]